MKSIIKKIIRFSLFAGVFLFVAIVSCNWYINNTVEGYLFDDWSAIPTEEYGLVLGTSKYVRAGDKNEYFENRMRAAVTLFEAQKIKKIIVSGDNRENNYNEPQVMRKELVHRGIPDSLIVIDANGFNTYNSIISYKQLSGKTDVTIISQRFHNERAVFIAREFGIHAIGYNAADIGFVRGFKVRVREYLAKVKIVFYLFFTD